jgi:hypothetical protein
MILLLALRLIWVWTSVGNRVELVHTSAGAQNANAVDVTLKVMNEIAAAEKLNEDLGNDFPIRVVVDATGVGWGVVSQLEKNKQDGRIEADIVRFVAGEAAIDSTKYVNKRAEMWWNGRLLMSPLKEESNLEAEEKFLVHLKMDKKSAGQLNAPNYGSDSHGRIRIERKVEMKRRGVNSPDRAEAVLMALYDPKIKPKRKARIII